MGMGQEKETQKAFLQFLKTNKKPLLIDADGINIISKNHEWFDYVPEKTILTPHLKELQRLLGGWESEDEKIEKVIEFSLSKKIIIVVKGAPTMIVSGHTVYKNATGNQALATAGSGDTLSGIITSFLAQGYEPVDAAILGVYIHGLTADIASKVMGYEAFIASDIIENLGKAFLSLRP
ncbi:Bifunctional NAD(P)H-hydrate repair enzyme Nnr [compost metagenome]